MLNKPWPCTLFCFTGLPKFFYWLVAYTHFNTFRLCVCARSRPSNKRNRKQKHMTKELAEFHNQFVLWTMGKFIHVLPYGWPLDCMQHRSKRSLQGVCQKRRFHVTSDYIKKRLTYCRRVHGHWLGLRGWCWCWRCVLVLGFVRKSEKIFRPQQLINVNFSCTKSGFITIQYNTVQYNTLFTSHSWF